MVSFKGKGMPKMKQITNLRNPKSESIRLRSETRFEFLKTDL